MEETVMTWILFAAMLTGAMEESPAVVEHVKVYYEPGRFGGWPANHGIWSWGDEILVGYSRGYYEDLGDRHHIDREKPEEHWLARSLDGGKTWQLEHPAKHGFLIPQGASLHGIETPGVPIPEWQDQAEPIDFTHPDFALTVRMTDVHGTTPSRYSYSYDRGRTWRGPFRLPDFDTPGIAARTDYIVNGPRDCMLFLTAGKSDGREGRPLMVRTTDGGVTWEFVSWIGPEPEGFAIMPATVRLSEDELLTVVRRRDPDRRYLKAYLSGDNGQTWEHLNDPVDTLGVGNAPALIRLNDGRLCVTFGYRAEPFHMGAKLSSDGGRTWSDEIVIRGDGANRDIGYPRSVQRADGKVVTVYYFSDLATGPERYIAATIWDPDVVTP
jgi:hypothetical protein